ncbi:MAG TPA: RNA polymerase sigma factor [Verrucomicrobiae bacterium]
MSFQKSDEAGSAACGSSAESEVPAAGITDQFSPDPGEPDREDYLRQLEASVPEVHRFVAQRIANKADAEDIAQQALLQAVAKLATFRSEHFRAWLFTIARRLIIDHYRAQNRVQFVELTEAAQGGTEPCLRTGDDAVHWRCDCRARLGKWVDCITGQLRLEEQVAVLLADAHGHSDKSSAVELGVTLASFKLLLHEARSRLSKVSGGTCVLLSGARTDMADGAPPEPALHADAVTNPKRAGCARPPAPASNSHNATFARRSGGGAASGQCPARGHCSEDPSHNCSAGEKCCLGNGACLSTKCRFGVGCRLGIKCCRQTPKLLALRARLLQALVLNPN